MARRKIHMSADTDLFHLFDVWSYAERLLVQYGLKAKGWKVVFDNTKCRGGECRYAQKEIGISAHLFAIWTFEQCRDTILHEVAHALTPGHGHDKVWKAKHAEIGGNAKRCWSPKERNHFPRQKRARNWIGTCPNGHTRARARKPLDGRRYSCGTCAPGVFDYRYELTWRKK
jgi:predicted SprT family Zn-dependent metalloprotease